MTNCKCHKDPICSYDTILKIGNSIKETESLKAKLDKACEVLEFYSEMECPSDITFTNTPCEDNGKCAREALQDIRNNKQKENE